MKLRVVLILAVMSFSVSEVRSAHEEEFFESRVRPLLVKRCYECHRRKAEGGLRLDSREAILMGGLSGAAIVPSEPRASLLWQVVSGAHAELSMPPDKPLNKSEVKILEQWITAGAPWPKALSAARATPDGSGITDEERAFWSFQRIGDPQIPQIDGQHFANPIDAFVTEQRARRELVANSIADPRTLVRRVTYDLTGLPPTPLELAAFEAAAAQDFPSAYAALIERLLDSKAYGERWAQHWLDLVRYADTAGDAADYPIPEAYKYRNYVIDAFNNDLPYDQFVREQIAGDLMPTDDEQESWRRVIATGYIAISRRIGVSPQGQRHITIEDTLNNLGKTFLGLSVGCARCHDHKFDPIPTSDYYALYGIFDSTVYPHVGAEHKPYRSDFAYRIGESEADHVLVSFHKTLEPWRKKERAAFERYRDFQRKPINIPGYNRDVAWQEVLDLRDEIRKVAETFPDLETAFAVSEGDAGDASIQKRGEPNQRGHVVRRGFLQILGGQTLEENAAHSGRLELAHWLTDGRNPLTARVMANRVWHHHFGRGLVATTSDFGVRGSRPSHPELLDFLARYLIDSDWSIKQLHRLIVLSETYRLSSDASAKNASIDPENIFLWRANRRRLDAEQIRDSILAVSGQLDWSVGTRHPFPHRLTYFYRQHEPFVGDFASNRRTIYVFRQRIRKNRFLDMFDGPDGNLHIGTRRPTTTSLQSLYLLNSPFIDTQSQLIAKRAIEASDSHADRLHWAFRHLFGRDPTEDELRVTEQQIERLASEAAKDSVEPDVVAWSSMVRAMLGSNAFMFVD